MQLKRYWIALFAALPVLCAAAVWMGGLNQDEGWYLYAANLVSEGRMPYRDFFYTQGPLFPIVYSAFTPVWKTWGILGARVLTLAAGLAGIVFASALAARLAPDGRKGRAALATAFLLGCNLYHLYYVAIPKTYALASFFLAVGFYLLSFIDDDRRSPALRAVFTAAAGLCIAFAAGTRISLGAILPVAGLWLLASRRWRAAAAFSAGGFAGLALVYAPFVMDEGAFRGLVAAQAYHTARGGFDPVWTVGSLSRLVRWYLPVFIILGLGDFRRGRVLLISAAAVFAVQMLAPFPYEDYQVPIMGLVAAFAAVNFDKRGELLVLGLCFATCFGSPLLEKWTVDGQDRFWPIKKDGFELAGLRDAARRIEALDPGGKELFTQDVYLAVETDRKVPEGFEMGPFAVLSDGDYERMACEAKAPVAALSGYSFAVEMPRGTERPVEKQMLCWELLKKNYVLAEKIERFGQNATPLLILKRK